MVVFIILTMKWQIMPPIGSYSRSMAAVIRLLSEITDLKIDSYHIAKYANEFSLQLEQPTIN